MDQDVEKYRRWIRVGANIRSASIFYLAKGIIDKLGDEGTALVVEQIKEMGRNSGKRMRQSFEKQGLDNSFKNYSDRVSSDDIVYRFAWEGSTPVETDEERVVEYTYCPIAEGFKMLGAEGVKVGELFCNNIDDAVIQAYNPEFECVRKSSLNRDGLCRLHFKKKQ